MGLQAAEQRVGIPETARLGHQVDAQLGDVAAHDAGLDLTGDAKAVDASGHKDSAGSLTAGDDERPYVVQDGNGCSGQPAGHLCSVRADHGSVRVG